MDIPVGVNNRVRGTRIDTYGAYQNIHEWWVTDAAEETTQGANGGS
jgi:hypothetical protein